MEGLIGINVSCRAARGHRFAAQAAELWYVYYVRVTFSAYTMRFVGSQDNVYDCIACFNSYK